MNANVTMTTRTLRNNVAVIDIDGEINAFAENALMDAYTEATSGGAEAIILNFGQKELQFRRVVR